MNGLIIETGLRSSKTADIMSIYQNFIVALFCILIFQGSLLGCPRSRPVGPTEETENKVGQRSTDTISGPMSG